MRQIKQKRSKSLLFTRFLVSYLALLVLPILLFSYIIVSTTQKIEKFAIEQNLTILEQARDRVDNEMRSLYNCVIGINYNSIVNKVLDGETSHDVADLMMSFKDLSAFEQEGNLLYVYSDVMDSLLSTKGCYNHIDKIYGTVLKYGDMDYAQFRDTYLTATHNGRFVPSTNVIIDSVATRAILYVQSVPIGPAKQKLGNILYFVEESVVLQPLKGLNIADGGWFCITAANGEVIAGYGQYPDNLSELLLPNEQDNTIYSGDLILTRSRSDYNGWQYTAAIPKRYILRESNSVRITVLLLLVLYMLLGVCFSFLVSVRNFKPIQEIADMVRNRTGDAGRRINEYNLLRDYVESLASNNLNLETSLDSYVKAMESTQISNLICGRYDTPEDMAEFATCKTIMEHQWFTVVLVNFFPKLTVIDQSVLDALVVRRLMAKQVVAALELPDFALGEIDVNKLGLLFYSNQKPTLSQTVEELYAKLAESLQEHVCIGVGSDCKGAQQISFSSLQADCALRVAVQQSIPIMYFDTIPRISEGTYFPENLRSTILQSITAGNLKQIKSTLKILDIENFTSRAVVPSGIEELLHEMYRLFVHLHTENSDIEIPDQRKDLEAHDRFYYYSNLLMRICTQNTDISENRKSKLCDEILHFVDDNYFDSNLCLSKLATQFDLSEAYLSYLFKKMLNVNFSSYLEEKRIAKATQMLQEGTLSVEEVASLIGYNSPHAFRRAFKKVSGVNPRDIRKKA